MKKNELDPLANDEIISDFKTDWNVIHILNMCFAEIYFRVTTFSGIYIR